MSWASQIPAELCSQHSPLIVLTGLDIKHNAIHKEIWDGFNARTNQKFRYKLLDGDHEYPKPKNKRLTEFHLPKGIMKTNWFHKHLYLVPSLVVVFFDLDWDEPNWKEKQMECSTKLELVRESLLDRNTRVILVLIQKRHNIGGDGDNGLARERYPALCTACSIKNNYIFLLHAEHLTGYIIKLEEDAFNEPTQSYYMLEIKSVKLKRDSLVKVTHQFLFVRLAIKIAFFNEMKADLFKAIEYYKQAYLSLLDIRTYDTNIFEIKTIAGLINFKLCQLFFDIKHPIDAIDQFRKHIDIFRNKIGPAEMAFEHSAWLSKQFELMGETFEDAIKKGYLNAVQTQHPGFYYHSAANQCIQRRANSKDFLRKPSTNKEGHSPIEDLNCLEFYGQRPWRQGQQGMDILDEEKERDGILSLQELETQETLTPLITNLYQKAITHFKLFNCKRMKQYLSVCMAEEHYFAKEYQESLNIYVDVLNDYKNEHWWPILTSILSNALKCAFLVADITNYCLLCIELIGKNVLLSAEDKSLIQKNLIKVIENEIPESQPHRIDINCHSVENALSKWKIELNLPQVDHKIIAAHASSMVPFVECKIRFGSSVFNSNQQCELSVYMRTNCTEVIKFSKLYIRFNLTNYNQYCIVENTENLEFEPNKIKEFKFSFLPESQDIGKALEVSSISLDLGNKDDSRVLTIHWKGDCKNALTYENYTKISFAKLFVKTDLNKIDSSGLAALDWDSLNNLQSTSIVARKSNIELKLEHRMPIFVNEFYAVKLTIDNLEENSIENILLTVEAQNFNKQASAPNDSKYRIWIGEIDKSQNNTTQTKVLANINSKSQLSEVIYVQLNEIMSINLLVKVKYDVDVVIKMVNYTNQTSIYTFSNSLEPEKNKQGSNSTETLKEMIKCGCIQDDTLKLDSIYPFKLDFNILSMQMKPIEVVRTGEPFLLLCEIKNETPYSLKFKNSSLKTPSNLKPKPNKNGQTEEVESFLKDEILKHHEMATECFCLVMDDQCDAENFNMKKPLALGEYLIDWRRLNPCKFTKSESQCIKSDSDDDKTESHQKDECKEDLFYSETMVKLADIRMEAFPFLIETSMPTFGTLEKHLTVVYTIKNKTRFSMLDIECTLEENEFFSISGNKLELIQIMPNDSSAFSFVVYPLQSGYCKLPKFHVKLNNFNFKTNRTEDGSKHQQQIVSESSESVEKSLSGEEQESLDSANLDSLVQSMLPTQIFIMPPTTNIASSS